MKLSVLEFQWILSSTSLRAHLTFPKHSPTSGWTLTGPHSTPTRHPNTPAFLGTPIWTRFYNSPLRDIGVLLGNMLCFVRPGALFRILVDHDMAPKWTPKWTPKLTQNGARTGPKMDPKWSPKWTQNGVQNGPKMEPKMNPKWIQNGSKMEPKMDPKWTPKWTQNGAQNGPTMEPKMDPKWGPKWTQNGAQNEPKMDPK